MAFMLASMLEQLSDSNIEFNILAELDKLDNYISIIKYNINNIVSGNDTLTKLVEINKNIQTIQINSEKSKKRKQESDTYQKEKKLTFDNTYYLGNVIENKAFGNGKLYSLDHNIIYIGEWQNSVYHGFGRLMLENGNYKEGIFEYGMLNGSGKLVLGNGGFIKYEGNWKNDKYHGYGLLKYPNGDYYQGNFENGHCHREGIKKNKENNIIYQGEWRFGVYHGSGTIYYSDGSYYRGNLEYGKRIGDGTLHKNHIIIYEGKWANNMYHGYGKLQLGDTIYLGQFMNGHKHSNGYKYYTNGNMIYDGEWYCDLYHGNGKLANNIKIGYAPNENNYFEGKFTYGKKIVTKK